MAKSKTTTKKTDEKPQEQLQEKTLEQPQVTEKPAAKRRVPSAVRRVPVQYTPRVPSARCPGC